MAILFISDIHLSPEQREITHEFFALLTKIEKIRPDAVFILGDLFNFWIGDKAVDDFSRQIAAEIKKTSKICPIFFQRGNRDFFIAEKFCALSEMTLLPDIFIFEYENRKILIEHGDLLCTDDVNYQKLRRVLRSKIIYRLAKIMPSFLIRKIAEMLRRKSKNATQRKTKSILNTNPQAIKQRFLVSKVDIIIHGHTHCPGVQSLDKNKYIVVLGDWNPMGKTFLFSSEQNLELILSGDLAAN
ncbi:MAG: UDP-2,3-diacylglucosamine diphosphatase [Cardiobacteriaceae bacterium]|nr:UDP-2,3-diacylglucosamine diphosphatase [Cardiobacteriaceae bacterium]